MVSAEFGRVSVAGTPCAGFGASRFSNAGLDALEAVRLNPGTAGATIASWRRPASKVIVFQRP
jgi:hypothetical protein